MEFSCSFQIKDTFFITQTAPLFLGAFYQGLLSRNIKNDSLRPYQARPTVIDSRSVIAGVQGFESLSPHKICSLHSYF